MCILSNIEILLYHADGMDFKTYLMGYVFSTSLTTPSHSFFQNKHTHSLSISCSKASSLIQELYIFRKLKPSKP
ncbi:hypothetical protein L1887_40254 [Cichorium endivia]|nr:hypothetical protein L1887_40254 [Cichorium endivia]